MLLAAQTLGVLAGALALGAILAGRLTRRSLALAAPLVCAGFACVLLGATLYPTARNLLAERARKASAPAGAAELLPGKSADAEVDFVEWVKSRLRRGETFHLATDDVRGYQWTSYRLLPNLLTGSADADVIVFYDRDPDPSEYDAGSFTEPERYEDGFAIARRLR